MESLIAAVQPFVGLPMAHCAREICDADVLLSDDPAWPWRDPRSMASLVIID